MATAHALNGSREQALARGREARELADACGDPFAAARARNGMALALPYGDPRGVTWMAEAVAIAREADLPAISGMLANLGGQLEQAGRMADARALGPEMAAAARRFGNTRRVFELKFMECNWALHAGGWAEAEQQATDLLSDAPSEWDRTVLLSVRFQLRFALGRLEGARADAEQHLRFAGTSTEHQMWEMAYVERAICEASLGNAEPALEAIAGWCGLEHEGYSESAVYISEAMWLTGATDRFGALPKPDVVTPWFEAASATAGGDLAQAAEIMQRIGSLCNEAVLRLLWAEHLADQGRHAEAAPHLERALEIYQAEGATSRINQAKAVSARAAS